MKDEFVLGLSGIGERFAVGLVRNGEVVFAVEEDKLRRFRGLGFGHLEGIGSRAVDAAVSGVPGGMRGIARAAYVPPVDASGDQVAGELAQIRNFLERGYGASPPLSAVDHVAAHLAFERAVHAGVRHVLMVGRSRAVYSGSAGEPYELDVPFSLVRGIERLAAFAGFSPAHIHHLENMARFGEPRFGEAVEGLLGEGAGGEKLEQALEETIGFGRRLSGQPLGQKHYDFAASVYAVLCRRIPELLRSIPEEKRCGAVAVCGGVFQSWSLNDAVAAAFPENRILASFAPGNAAGAIGGPLVLSGSAADAPVGPFLGPEYTREEIKSVLDNSKARYAFHSSRDAVDRVCALLGEGKMVGWFRGRCEFGYRALGARSVFASPANPYACDNLSSYLKKRPAYFAYAVAIDQDDPRVAGIESPYLSRSARLPEYFGDAPVRVQTVTKPAAPDLWQVLKAFRKSGVGALLNTSLNYFDEPIACTPRDALKTFYASGLDVLVMEGFLLTKN